KHEGKVTGLAAHGKPRFVPLLKEFVDEMGGTLVNRGGVTHLGAIRELERRLPPGWRREELAASIQAHTEELVRRYVGHWSRRTGLHDVALAGGVFANVRVNQEVHRLDAVERIFVHPHMGDGGLATGAALAACVPGILERPMPRDEDPLPDVYLGGEPSDAEIHRALGEASLRPEALDAPLEEE